MSDNCIRTIAVSYDDQGRVKSAYPNNFAGFEGEHQATGLEIQPPAGVTASYYRLLFGTTPEPVSTEPLHPQEGVLRYELPQSLTLRYGRLPMTLAAVTVGEGGVESLSKMATYILSILPSVGEPTGVLPGTLVDPLEAAIASAETATTHADAKAEEANTAASAATAAAGVANTAAETANTAAATANSAAAAATAAAGAASEAAEGADTAAAGANTAASAAGTAAQTALTAAENAVAATIAVGSVSSGQTPSVSNSGTASAAILNFVLPKGDKGDTGSTGDSGVHTGSAAPTDPVKTVWIDTAGTPELQAADIGVADTAGSYTSGNLEGVLAEIGSRLSQIEAALAALAGS